MIAIVVAIAIIIIVMITTMMAMITTMTMTALIIASLDLSHVPFGLTAFGVFQGLFASAVLE